ncbi:MAG: hypothetical protein LUG93_13490, partial [Lachnospiraceae bacterium]|nr:hypothetical protein [Lachnospiraceae bacterium]
MDEGRANREAIFSCAAAITCPYLRSEYGRRPRQSRSDFFMRGCHYTIGQAVSATFEKTIENIRYENIK